MLYEGYTDQSRNAILTQTRSVSYSEVASITLLTWDTIVTFSEEVELIWEKNWTPAKGMYLVARYLPWVFQLALLPLNIGGSTGLRFSIIECKRWMTVQAVILQLIITSVDAILITRVYALYNRSRALLGVLSALFLAELFGLSYILAVVTPKLTFNDECFVTSSPSLFVVYWIVSLAFETILFVLTLVKFGCAVKQGWGRRPVMRDFVTDGTWAYTLIFVTMLVNAMLYKFNTTPLAGGCSPFSPLQVYQGSRVILNPRRRNISRVSITSSEPITIPLSPLTPLTPHIWVSPYSPTSPDLPSPFKDKDNFGNGIFECHVMADYRTEQALVHSYVSSDCGAAL
ncbi:uncharacterized protein PHACADRAFT_186572 [Phanerochaete carnosa HHB-10118-sp]|uniref:DUF6533 domain-containing protein n=1 Tax=Phanerochaete carnosa (strain HHB-10118-sp) TaxID=650164 RepID=K5URC9_PHACS|nr:uncharacterized protein PHACADRAFT_186572 [Phanerochaete carnosa HHB-10118-sp]EKM52421.1 hypothetical protein PHACADRAFT_186572 [Phanerochaete carnosa HHB-10118-sp]